MIGQTRDIRDAILENRCIDGSRSVLSGQERGEYKARPFVPPIFAMALDVQTQAGAAQPQTDATLTLKDFETLSLRAREGAIADHRNGGNPIEDAFPVLDADAIMAAIADVAEKIDHDESGLGRLDREQRERLAVALPEPPRKKSRKGWVEAEQAPDRPDEETKRLLSRRGLQIVGCRIRGDLVLVNARLPFSVRLIGCLVEGAVVVDHCALTTLDLSGSVVQGVRASFLNAAGSVRMRRTASTGPLDFSGARIRGLVDASDCIVLPFHTPPNAEVFVGDRGAFNLSLATIEYEFHCARARIYGGLNLKGASIQRSMFLDRAILLSPLGLLEMLLTDRAAERPTVLIPKQAREMAAADNRLATWTRQDVGELHLETMRGFALELSLAPVFSRLMVARRASTLAIRGDGLELRGSIFAWRIKTAGGLRLKYAKIGGGLHLNGARLRSVQDVDASIELFRQGLADDVVGRELLNYRREGIADLEIRTGERTQDALDVREAEIGGHVSLEPFKMDAGARGTLIRGVLAMAGVTIGGDLQLTGANFEFAHTAKTPGDPALYLDGGRIDGGLDLREAKGVFSVQATRLRVLGSVLCASKPVRAPGGNWIAPPDRAEDLSGKFDFTGSHIGGDATFLFNPETGPDLDLQHVTIGGRLSILPAATLTYEMSRQDYDQANVDADHARLEAGKTLRKGGDIYEMTRDVPWIDLRNARARIISHPPSAWPQQHGLLVGGFHYEAYRGVGPLVAEEGTGVPLSARKPRWIGSQQAAMAAGAIGVAAAVVISIYHHPSAIQAVEQGWQALMLAGPVNLAVMTALVLSLPISALFRRSEHRSKPMAIYWLARQRSESNPLRRWVGWPLEPYIRAARVLRAAGETLAANRVELERLRIRRNSLAWRSHFMGKAFFRLVDWLALFGYGLGRTAGWVAASVVAAACVFQVAYNLDYLQHNRDSGGTPQFLSILYATDLVVPVVGLSHEEEWRPAAKCRAGDNCTVSATDVMVVKGFLAAEWLFRGLGLFLCSIIAAALTTRAEAMFAKIED